MLAKAALRATQNTSQTPATGPASTPEAGRRRTSRADVGLGILLVVAVAWAARTYFADRDRPQSVEAGRQGPTTANVKRETAENRGPGATAPDESPETDVSSPVDETEGPPTSTGAGAVGPLSEKDRKTLAALEHAVEGRGTIGSAEILLAEELNARHHGLPEVDQLVWAVFQQAAASERQQGRTDEALRYIERLTEIWPESLATWRELYDARASQGRWREAEQVARKALAAHPTEAEFYRRLARALVRQDRSEEAADILRQALARGEDLGLRGMLTEIETGLSHERDMGRAQSSHFTLHVEAGASAREGRQVLDFLERQYTDLGRTLDYEPPGEIPVILYPTAAGVEASGGPRWAVATYSHADGRIRVSTADLSRGLTADLEETLVHELAHAFIAGRTRMTAPRDVNEGLAQYVSGRRPRPVVIDTRALDPGSISRVSDFYEAALSFVAFLMKKQGQAGMNDLLKALGEEDVDQAFRRAYGLDYDEAHKAWVKQLR